MLSSRRFILVSGDDKYDFLQGLITNNVDQVKNGKLSYSWFLTPQGKYLYDFFLFEKEETIYIDCTDFQAMDFFKKLKLYKMRSKVVLTLAEDCHSVLTVWGGCCDVGFKDPRNQEMGRRIYFKKDDSLPSYIKGSYIEKRYSLSIAEGAEEIELKKSNLLEYRMDDFHAVDFNKGCYIGQELTARVHYRGLLKKKVFSFQALSEGVVKGDVVKKEQEKVGEVCCFDPISKTGLAMVKLKSLESAPAPFAVGDIFINFRTVV